jgi:phage repressor protein C with HTH and peptisase S24 domain
MAGCHLGLHLAIKVTTNQKEFYLNMKELFSRVAWAIKIIKTDPNLDKGIRDIDLAKKLGTNDNTLAKYRKEQGLLKSEVVEKLVSLYNFNPQWLFKGQGEPFPGARTKYPEVCGPETKLLADQPEDAQTGKFVLISQVNGRISAGAGLLPDDSVDIKIAFRRNWIKKKGSPENMSLIKVSGDSMQPTLLSGDIALVDHGHNYIDPQGGIYAIAVDGEIMIKRVQPIPGGKILVISDNKNYERLEMDSGQSHINGKVIWFCRDIER